MRAWPWLGALAAQLVASACTPGSRITSKGRLPGYLTYGRRHVLCNAHILRPLNELGVNHRRQCWAQGFIEPSSTPNPSHTARAAGKTRLSDYLRRRWDDVCARAARAAPPPIKGLTLYGTNKTAGTSPPRSLPLQAPRPVLAYTRDLTNPFVSSQAERDLRMIKLHHLTRVFAAGPKFSNWATQVHPIDVTTWDPRPRRAG